MDSPLLHLLIGFFVGIYGTLVGLGGGILLVPYFLFVLKLPHEVAVGTSLAIVAINAFSGAIGYFFRRIIDFRAGVVFALATVPGAILGAYLVDLISTEAFEDGFGLFLIAVAVYLFWRKSKKESQTEWREGRFRVQRTLHTDRGIERYSYNEAVGVASSLGVGVVASLLGIGGGVVHVPLMIEVLKFPVAVAIATSQFILAFTALSGAVFHGFEGHLSWPLIASVGVGAVIGAQVGVRLSPRIKSGTLIRVLALGLIFVGIKLVLG